MLYYRLNIQVRLVSLAPPSRLSATTILLAGRSHFQGSKIDARNAL